MKLTHLAMIGIIAAVPAFADTITLQIENDAGMVTTRDGYTPTECDAAALLLNGATDVPNPSVASTWGGNLVLVQPKMQPHTSKLTKAQCMHPTQGTKP